MNHWTGQQRPKKFGEEEEEEEKDQFLSGND